MLLFYIIVYNTHTTAKSDRTVLTDPGMKTELPEDQMEASWETCPPWPKFWIPTPAIWTSTKRHLDEMMSFVFGSWVLVMLPSDKNSPPTHPTPNNAGVVVSKLFSTDYVLKCIEIKCSNWLSCTVLVLVDTCWLTDWTRSFPFISFSISFHLLLSLESCKRNQRRRRNQRKFVSILLICYSV